MFNDKTVQMIIDLEKAGVRVFLTEKGYIELFKSVKEEEIEELQKNAG